MLSRARAAKGIRLARALAATAASPRRWGPFLDAFDQTNLDHSFAVSFAQSGEDLALLQLMPMARGTYLDIGAHHPSRFSVTRLLYQRGWSGVNVDANADSVDVLAAARARDVNIHAFVGDPRRGLTRSFAIFDEPALSTGNQEWQERFVGEGHAVVRTDEVPVLALEDICRTYFGSTPIDLLNVDVEGSDFEVLLSADWDSFSPRWICVEAPVQQHVIAHSNIAQLLARHGYELRAVLPQSLIFAKRIVDIN